MAVTGLLGAPAFHVSCGKIGGNGGEHKAEFPHSLRLDENDNWLERQIQTKKPVPCAKKEYKTKLALRKEAAIFFGNFDISMASFFSIWLL